MSQSQDSGSKEKNIHSGHRQRLRQQFVEGSMDALSDVQVLELLLFYAIPRRDTNPIAHQLLDAFDSLSGVFDATLEELMDHGNLSQNAAMLLKLVPAVARRQQMDRVRTDRILDTTQKCGQFLVPYFYGATEEQVYLLALDAKCKVLGCTKLFSGTMNSVSLTARSVVECALRLKATSVVLAHNHPSGIAVPSSEDIATTQCVIQALELVGVLLADHIVVADDDYVSMLDSGFLSHGRS
jgi:DNA repair protein RadC